MLKSLRWRLLAWQALILLLVIGGFGTALYWEIQKSRIDEVDAELLSAARVLEGSLRAVPPEDLNDEEDPDRPPREDDRRRRPPPPGREEDEDGPPPPPPPRGRNLPPDYFERALRLPRQFEEREDASASMPYFVIWKGNGDLLKSSVEDSVLPPRPQGIGPDYSLSARKRGMLREVVLLGPARTEILVGRSIERELGYLHRLAWRLGFTSLGALAVGLLGGWWIAGKATRPIEAMSVTAASVTASSLSQRIEVEDVEDELGRLANILNSMLDRIEGAFHQQRRFTADASHELRTPLAVVLSHLELALSKPRSVDEYRDSLETCLKAARRMKSIVEDLLLLARADAGKLELRKQRVDLRNLAVECASLFEPLALDKHVQLLVQGGAVPATVDPDRFSQVLNNLTANAVRHCRPGGIVRISAAARSEEILLTVEDDGEGIPLEHLSRIFDRFYRVDAARSRDSGGSGLGLAICKSIVEVHGGRITVSSEPDRGASFVIHLERSSTE